MAHNPSRPHLDSSGDVPAEPARTLTPARASALDVARAAGVDPEIAVRAAAARFRERVEGAARLAAEAGEDFEALGPDAQLEWYARFRARP